MEDTILIISAFGAVTSFILMVVFLLGGSKDPVEARVDTLANTQSRTETDEQWSFIDDEEEKFRVARMLMPADEKGRREIGERLVQAGLYKRNSIFYYLTVKGMLMITPVVLGGSAGYVGLISMQYGIIFGAMAGLFGTIAPSFWLDAQKRSRQSQLRRALPDALDVIIVCLEGGMSLPGAFAKVTSELRGPHPMLAAEMAIVQREIQMGRSTGDALKQFATRFDLEELRSLASVVVQAEKYGSSVIKAMRVHADSLRIKRQQAAEEMAAKASVQILFPTLFFIFPALFVVLLGPAVFDIIEMFASMKTAAS